MFNKGFSFNFMDEVEANEDLIKFLSTSFMLSSTMFTAAKLDIFSLIDSGDNTLAALSARTKIPENEMQRLLVFCVAIGFIVNDNRQYTNTPATKKLLTRSSSDNILSVIHHYQHHVYQPFFYLEDCLRQRKNCVDKWTLNDSRSPEPEMYSELTYEPQEYQHFINAMNTFSRGVGADIAEHIKHHDIKNLVDLGCGGCSVSIELLKAIPSLNIIAVDKPIPLQQARAVACSQRVDQSIQFMEGDFTDEIGIEDNAVDAVLISAVLGDWDKSIQFHILSIALRILKPGGVLLVSETLLNNNGTGPLLPALLSLYVLTITQGGKNFTQRELCDQIESIGFTSIETIDNRKKGIRDLVIAIKPENRINT